MHRHARLAFPLVAILGCGGGGAAAPPGDAGPRACTPSREAWNATVRPLVQQHCGGCHGARPSYGAPYTLLDYDSVVRTVNDERAVERMADRVAMNTMPPSTSPIPPDEARRAIVEWASCGARTAPPAAGLRSTAPVFRSPARTPTDMEHFDLTARRFAVGPDVTDRYQCFVYDAPVTAPRFIRRFELLLDEERVVHHVVLLRDPDRTGPAADFQCMGMPASSQYLYAWAPGQDAFEFPDGGLRVEPGQRFILQLHYNNGARVPDVVDASGVRVFHTAPEGTEYGMVAIGPVGFQVPARSQGVASSHCTVRSPMRILAGMPHMHEIGTGFDQELVRAGGAREPLIALTGWRFDAQLFYDFSKQLMPGDRVTTRCTFNNPNATPVRSGTGTRDEMCFNFAYVTPPPASRYCDEGDADPTMVTYAPGACARPGAPTDLALVEGTIRVGEGAPLAGGAIPAGRWALTGHAFWLNTTNLGIGELDLERSTLRSRGQAWVEGNRFTADVSSALHAAIAGTALDRAIPLSVSGTFEPNGASPMSLRADCGRTDTLALQYGVAGDELTVSVPPQMFGPLRITARYTFRRAP